MSDYFMLLAQRALGMAQGLRPRLSAWGEIPGNAASAPGAMESAFADADDHGAVNPPVSATTTRWNPARVESAGRPESARGSDLSAPLVQSGKEASRPADASQDFASAPRQIPAPPPRYNPPSVPVGAQARHAGRAQSPESGGNTTPSSHRGAATPTVPRLESPGIRDTGTVSFGRLLPLSTAPARTAITAGFTPPRPAEPPIVRIHIGRVDVRAAPSARVPEKPARVALDSAAGLSLSDYLRRGQERGGRS